MLRVSDIFLSCLAVLFFLPVFILISILLRLTGEGEVIFRQNRIGKNEKYFSLIKFVTMKKDSPSIGTKEITLPDDERVLPVGRYLRKSKLNEIPQLINVIKGDISLIGYRPQTARYWNCFTALQKEILAQHRPGLSGVSSILLRDEEAFLSHFSDPIDADEKLLMPFKGRVETWYVENKSVSLYFSLIFMTMIKILLPNSTTFFFLIGKMRQYQKELDDIIELHGKA